MPDFLTWMRRSTPEDCRMLAIRVLARDDWRESVEMVSLLLELGAKERTPAWFNSIDTAIGGGQ